MVQRSRLRVRVCGAVLRRRSDAVMLEQPYLGMHHSQHTKIDSQLLMTELKRFIPTFTGAILLCEHTRTHTHIHTHTHTHTRRRPTQRYCVCALVPRACKVMPTPVLFQSTSTVPHAVCVFVCVCVCMYVCNMSISLFQGCTECGTFEMRARARVCVCGWVGVWVSQAMSGRLRSTSARQTGKGCLGLHTQD